MADKPKRTLADLEPYEYEKELLEKDLKEAQKEGDQAKIAQIEARLAGLDFAPSKYVLQEVSEYLQPSLKKHKIPDDIPNEYKWMFLAFILERKSRRRRRRGWDDAGGIMNEYRVAACREAIAKSRRCPVEDVPEIEACQRLIDDNSKEWVKKRRDSKGPLTPKAS